MFHPSKTFQESQLNELKEVIYTPYSSRLIERIFSGIFFDEPLLLVGDTGCGKTTLVQHCARMLRKTLFVYNMN